MSFNELYAQAVPGKKTSLDTTYVNDHTGDLILRVYGSNKFTRLSYGAFKGDRQVLYKPNSNYNAGVGFNYKFLGINLSFRAPFVNDDNDKYGKTTYLDLQAYVYARKMTLNFYGQTYEGYYLANTDILRQPPAGNGYLVRSGIQTRNLGATAEYIFNHSKFSYRAVYLQNERQRKSAGSFLLGAGLHYLNVRADSAIIPAGLVRDVFDRNPGFNHSATGSVTVNGGYAHTLVIGEQFFLMGSLLAGAGLNYLHTRNDVNAGTDNDLSLYLNGIIRLGAGYNTDGYYAGVYFTTSLMRGGISEAQQYETGVLRIAVGKRFTRIPKAVRLIDKAGTLLGID